jgi:Holliday junction resolvase RusA-like endonuclease
MTVGFRVFGNPAPQGSKIPGVARSTGKLFVREQAGKKLTDWRADVKEAALLAKGEEPMILGAVALTVIFFVPRPASISEKKRPYPVVEPDLDKMVRTIGDALQEKTGAGMIKDDKQIIVISAAKRYATDDQPAGAWIVVSEISTLQ